MTYVNPFMTELPVGGPIILEPRSMKEITDMLFRQLSWSDRGSFQALENIYDTSSVGKWDGEARKILLADSFTSPLYSESGKRLFAATHIDDSAILLVGDQFMTEEIIFSHVSKPVWKFLSSAYANAVMGSSHLSSRILDVMLKDLNYGESQIILEDAPDSLITPSVIKRWMAKVVGVSSESQLSDNRKFAAHRIRQAHPEYEDCPDDWTLKVFCG